MPAPETSPITLELVGAALAALSALATAAFGLLDATKAFWGGVSNVGLGHLRQALKGFDKALDASMGAGAWWVLVRANWLNGMAKADQKAVVRGLIKLGLHDDAASSQPGPVVAQLAAATGVDAAELKGIAIKLDNGAALTEQELSLLGRLTAILDAKLDVGFELADQQYRNVSRVAAGLLCVALALTAREIWAYMKPHDPTLPSCWVAAAVGLLAVPVAPIAKDLTSALTAAMKAIKLGRA